MTKPRESGIGPVCEKKMRGGGESSSEWIVEILEATPRMTIAKVFNQTESWKVCFYLQGQFLDHCGCKQLGCKHIEIAKKLAWRKILENCKEIS